MESVHVSDGAVIITNEILERILRQYYQNDEIEVVDFKASPASRKGDNYTCIVDGIVIQARVNGEDKAYNIIAKMAPADVGRRKMLEDSKILQRESDVYTLLLPAIRKFLKESNVDIDVPPAAGMLTAKDEPEPWLVFEDLRTSGYRVSNKMTGLDYNHSQLVISELAKLHAVSRQMLRTYVQNGETRPTKEIFECVRDIWQDDLKPELTAMMESFMTKNMELAIGHVETYYKNDLSRDQEEGQGLVARMTASNNMELFNKSKERQMDVSGPLAAINHGDCWINNLLFKYDQNNPTAVKFVDFQICRHANICMDLVYFIYTSTTRDLRNEHLEDLLQLYLTTFNDTVKLFDPNEELITFDALRNAFSHYRIVGFTFAVFVLPAMMAAPEECIDMNDIPTDESKAEDAWTKRINDSSTAMRKNSVFLERLVGVVKDMADAGVI